MSLIGLLANAQVSETRPIGSFSKIEIGDNLEVVLVQDDVVNVSVEAPNTDALASVETTVKRNVLYISRSKAGLTGKVIVYTPVVEKITAKASANVIIADNFESKKMAIHLYSKARFLGNLTVDKLSLLADSGAELNVKAQSYEIVGTFLNRAKANVTGQTANVSFKAKDGALCNARNLESNYASIKADQNSTVLINGSGNLALCAANDSEIRYFGTPEHVSMGIEMSQTKVQ